MYTNNSFGDGILYMSIITSNFKTHNYTNSYDMLWYHPNVCISSSGHKDEMSAAAAWLYKVTGENKYLYNAESYYPKGKAWGFNWNDDNVGAAVSIN